MAPNESTIEFHKKSAPLSSELKQIALRDLGETIEVRENSLRQLRQWLLTNPDLKQCRSDDLFLLRFLRSQKFNLDKTKQVLLNYLKMRVDNPEWFTKLDPSEQFMEEMCSSGFITVLPERDAKGRRVLFSYIDKIDLTKHKNCHVMRTMMATIETLMEDEENQIRGITYVFYCKGVTLAHLSIWTPADAARLFGTCEKNLGVRHVDINLVKLPFTMWAVLEFVKQFLSSKIKSRINIHSSNSSLSDRLGSASVLPEELDGSGSALGEMGKSWRKCMIRHKSRLLGLDKMVKLTEPVEVKPTQEALSETNRPKATGLWAFMPSL